MLTLAGRGALVVGARRVGGLVVRRLAAEGVRLAIAYRNSRAEAEALRDAVAPLAARTTLCQGDISVEEDVQRIVRAAQEELEDLSFVINLASDFPEHPSIPWTPRRGTMPWLPPRGAIC